MAFGTIYLYEQAFSTLVTEVKRENTESDMQQSHSIKLNTGDLVSAKQQYMSHYISGSQFCPPNGHLVMARDIFVYHNSGGITQASSQQSQGCW